MLSLLVFIQSTAEANLLAQNPLIGSHTFDNSEERSTGSIASFIASEGPIALKGVLSNIGSGGALAPGLVVASPSKANPDCQCISWMNQQPSYPSPNVSSLLHVKGLNKKTLSSAPRFLRSCTLDALLFH